MRYQVMRIMIFAFFVTFYVFGCASRPPIIQVQEVLTPMPTPCVSEEAKAWLEGTRVWPDNRHAIVTAPNHEARVNLMIAGRIARDGWIEDAIEQLQICAELPSLD
jgi:hypothetical protein